MGKKINQHGYLQKKKNEMNEEDEDSSDTCYKVK